MNLQLFVGSFFLGVALVLAVLPEEENVPRFSCRAVDDAWRQHRTGFDLEADPRILRIFRHSRYTYSDLKGACE